MRKPPIHRWSGWGEMLCMGENPGRIVRMNKLPPGPSEAVTAGKGGERERAQVSPKEEPEQSGLCDDVDGGKCYVWGKIPAGLSAWRSHAAAKRRTSIFAELKS